MTNYVSGEVAFAFGGVYTASNNPASPSPAVEADGVYVFFPDYGLVAYTAAGQKLWKLPLGPFNNIYGMGASPVIAGHLLILACDQSLGSYLMALDKRTGKQVWKVDRPRAALDSENGMLAIRLGGAGDMSDTAIRWKYQRSVPQLPSPLLYRNVLYMVNDNGIVITLHPDTGAVIKQGRLTGAPGAVFASPIAADGHVFFTTEAGAVVVVSPGGELTVESVNALNEEAYATPAVADGRIYVRTTQALYAFGAS